MTKQMDFIESYCAKAGFFPYNNSCDPLMQKLQLKLVLTCAFLWTLCPLVQAQSMLNENFDGPGLPGWQLGGESFGELQWNVGGGSFNMTGNTAGFGATASMDMYHQVANPPGADFRDWTLEMRVWMPLNHRYGFNIYLGSAFGAIGRYLATFQTFQGGHTGVVDFSSDGGNSAHVLVQRDTRHVLKLVSTPNTLTGYLNGQLMGSLAQATSPSFEAIHVVASTNIPNLSSNPARIDYIRVVPEPSPLLSMTLLVLGGMVGRRRSK